MFCILICVMYAVAADDFDGKIKTRNGCLRTQGNTFSTSIMFVNVVIYDIASSVSCFNRPALFCRCICQVHKCQSKK